MNTLKQVMAALKKQGNPERIQVFANHGAPPDQMFGVSVADMKVIAKQIKGKQELAYELYETGNGDAQYLAGMVADGAQMTKVRLDQWARKALWQMVSEYTVPWVASESKHAQALALKWMNARKEGVATSGWNTYSGMVTVTPDDELDLAEVDMLLDQIDEGIDDAMNRVRYTMNGFVIAVGTYVKPLSKKAKSIARRLGKVEVELGGTSCKVPLATEAISKAEKAGRAGKKRKTIKC
ncbi:MAG: DNA alkylation repair protein [Planctomycetes bacterium]|nr:DNA alkylation repair protein [Planctomycetota bacterium]